MSDFNVDDWNAAQERALKADVDFHRQNLTAALAALEIRARTEGDRRLVENGRISLGVLMENIRDLKTLIDNFG